ncbi:MAG: CvpA family protein, partial [Clostridia bacterium]|nr:CvpA family protein [Clostridia bacterium]
EGTPYWICPILDKTIGLFGGTDVIGAVLVDAATGECVEYTIEALRTDKTLQWIDRVYDSDLIVEQYNYYGKYRDGFWNSILGQKNVITSTQGYNYIAKDDDVWMYTGVTSVTSDSSITGFVLVNQRTKETQYYPVTGGTEASAQEAAEGRVLDLGYKATFPLIVNIDGNPTYFMSLKDEQTQIVQQYALINVNQYNKIGATSTDLSACLDNYRKSLKANGAQINEENVPVTPENEAPKADVLTATGEVTEIRTAVKGGESYYYVKLALNESYFAVSASEAEEVVILNVGDSVTVTYTGEGSIIAAETFTIN